MEDGAKARKTFLEADSNYHLSLVFRYLDTFPRPPGIPEWPEIIPAMDAASLDTVIDIGRHVAVGTPDEVDKAIERFADTGADQLSFGMLSTLHVDRVRARKPSRPSASTCCRTFDKDPDPPHDHAAARRRRLLSTTRPRLGARRRSAARVQPEAPRRRAGGRSPRPPAAGTRCGAHVDPVALLDAVPLELGPQVVDHGRHRPALRRAAAPTCGPGPAAARARSAPGAPRSAGRRRTGRRRRRTGRA